MRLLRPKNRTNGSPPAKQSLRRWFAALAAFLIATLGVVTLPSAAMADPNNDIVVDQVTIGGGSGPNGQLVIGDTIEISGSWDASAANPQEGDEFTIGLPSELDIPANVPFNLTGPRPDGSDATWATCMADADTDIVTCTLTDEVTANPESVLGEFLFEVNAVEATTEESLIFDLNGTDTPVELPGEGGIDDGIVIPDEWGKSGEMNSNNWSMTWEIELPGASLQGHDVINIADQLSDNHQLCEPSGFNRCDWD